MCETYEVAALYTLFTRIRQFGPLTSPCRLSSTGSASPFVVGSRPVAVPATILEVSGVARWSAPA
jgi:hypothetical protein